MGHEVYQDRKLKLIVIEFYNIKNINITNENIETFSEYCKNVLFQKTYMKTLISNNDKSYFMKLVTDYVIKKVCNMVYNETFDDKFFKHYRPEFVTEFIESEYFSYVNEFLGKVSDVIEFNITKPDKFTYIRQTIGINDKNDILSGVDYRTNDDDIIITFYIDIDKLMRYTIDMNEDMNM